MPEETIQPTALGQAVGDYYYVFTQKGPLGHLPVSFRSLAQLTALYAMASQLPEAVRSPILASLTNGIRQQAGQMTVEV